MYVRLAKVVRQGEGRCISYQLFLESAGSAWIGRISKRLFLTCAASFLTRVSCGPAQRTRRAPDSSRFLIPASAANRPQAPARPRPR